MLPLAHVSATKIQADNFEESIVYSLIKLMSEELVSLGLPLITISFFNRYLKKPWCFNICLLQESEPDKNTYEQCTAPY